MLRLLKRAIDDWLERHRNPTSLVLHIIGIPACFVAAPILLITGQWLAAAICFVVGYALQFLGHLIAGNTSGEAMLFRWLARRR